MLPVTERKQIIDLIQREVIPAIGCTEPIAVALCVARAAETLGAEPEKIIVRPLIILLCYKGSNTALFWQSV